MHIYSTTDPGNTRETNEDATLARSLPTHQLIAVADGMGGHASGDVASKIATEEVSAIVTDAIDDVDDHEALLTKAIERANERIHEEMAENPEYEGMGTTLVAAILHDSTATIANVGDSRAYRIGTDIEQITTDHSLVQQLIEEGQLTESEAKDHPHRHVLAQALGTDESLDPDFYEVMLDDEVLLLCSDGLPEEVDDSTIQNVVAKASDLETAGESLIRQANENGGSDNISVVLARPAGLELDILQKE